MGEEQPSTSGPGRPGSGQETASDPDSEAPAGDDQGHGHAEQDGGRRSPQDKIEANPCPTASPTRNTAAVATLGTERDKNDFFDTRSRIFREKAMVEIANDSNTLNKLKHWFSSRTTDEVDEPSCQSYVNADTCDEKKEDRQPEVSLQAHSMSSSTTSLGDGTFDRSLLTRDERIDGSSGDVELGTARSARKRMFGKARPLPGTEEEERVMGECSFFYSTMDDDERQTTQVSGAVSKAKREWTERRYRRRLRQSHFGNPSWYGEAANEIRKGRSKSPTQENRTPEHRQVFLAAHEALNAEYDNEYNRNRFAIRKRAGYDDYDDQIGLDLVLENEIVGEENEIRADLTLSSLAIRGGLIKLPQDNVRLVHDPHLQPGILSIENDGKQDNGLSRTTQKPGTSDQSRQHRSELSYVLTVDEHLYQRLVQEMVDSYRLPCGIYYCCHVTDGDHVGIGVAVSALFCIFLLMLIGMIIWPIN